jgi:hypothetical protein
VIITDVEASNGVIHVIDTVILPPAEAPATLPTTGAPGPYGTVVTLGLIGLALVSLGLGLHLLRPSWVSKVNK